MVVVVVVVVPDKVAAASKAFSCAFCRFARSLFLRFLACFRVSTLLLLTTSPASGGLPPPFILSLDSVVAEALSLLTSRTGGADSAADGFDFASVFFLPLLLFFLLFFLPPAFTTPLSTPTAIALVASATSWLALSVKAVATATSVLALVLLLLLLLAGAVVLAALPLLAEVLLSAEVEEV